MEHDTHPGAKALKSWRKAEDWTQGELAERLVPKVTQGAVCRWEDSTPQRPELSTAVQIQRLSRGDVPATLWGYSRAEVDAVMGVAADSTLRDDPPEASPVERPSHPAVA